MFKLALQNPNFIVMKMMKKSPGYFVLFYIFLLMISCTKDHLNFGEDSSTSNILTEEISSQNKNAKTNGFKDCNINALAYMEGDISCTSTSFENVLFGYFDQILNEPFFDFTVFNYYLKLNRDYVTHYRGPNYFGKNGEYTKLVEKRSRELSKFWDLNKEVVINAQHSNFLDDREILTDMIESFDRTVRNRDEAYAKADLLLEMNRKSPNFPENPIFALETFTKSNGLIVLGDGLIQVLTEAGIEESIAISAVLAHEWWHQLQFENSDVWKEIKNINSVAERSRFLELEADFAAAYFLAHKRGATYNWKRIEEFFSLSFNVGDCGIEDAMHHGTPNQRLQASRQGYEVAQSARKKGFILTPDQVHQVFVENLEVILN